MNNRDYNKFKNFYLNSKSTNNLCNDISIYNDIIPTEKIIKKRIYEIRSAFKTLGIDYLIITFTPKDYIKYAGYKLRQLTKSNPILRDAQLGKELNETDLQIVHKIHSANDLIRNLNKTELYDILLYFEKYYKKKPPNINDYNNFVLNFNAYLN